MSDLRTTGDNTFSRSGGHFDAFMQRDDGIKDRDSHRRLQKSNSASRMPAFAASANPRTPTTTLLVY